MPTRAAFPCTECGRARSGHAPGVLLCRCHEKRRAIERAERKRTDQLAAVTRVLADLDPRVTLGQVEDLVGKVAPGAVARAALVRHLAADPGALTAGGSRMPKIVAEFIYAALSLGVGGLVSPAVHSAVARARCSTPAATVDGSAPPVTAGSAQ